MDILLNIFGLWTCTGWVKNGTIIHYVSKKGASNFLW